MADEARERLREAVITALAKQGWRVNANGEIQCPANMAAYRAACQYVVSQIREAARPSLEKYEPWCLAEVANGNEVDPQRIYPTLERVHSDSWQAVVWRWVAIHWSVPVSRGYGRRLRYLVRDRHIGKVMGIIGLGDPVYSLADRDRWIGWSADQKKARLWHVLDAYICGAVPPYSQLLGGKLIALLITSQEVQDDYAAQYGGRAGLISGQQRPGVLAAVTTMGAFGRASVLERLAIGQRRVWEMVGWTRGWGDWQFLPVYELMRAYCHRYLEPSAKPAQMGRGWESRREVVQRCLPEIGLPVTLRLHGMRRAIYVAALGAKTREFLRGEVDDPQCDVLSESIDALASYARERWIVPRAERRPDYQRFRRDQYRLWPRHTLLWEP